MLSNITLELVDGVRVVVPDSLNLLTSYVLREQADWFEDEIKFLRRLLRPGQKTIDIGANYGIYTLTLAKLVGPTGRVWAFEPASSTANLLAAGIASNAFANVVLLRNALSSQPGVAQLALHENSEMNELVRVEHFAGMSETVSCVTLDDSARTHAWRDIDFVKIDAEGEETNILKGGATFLASESPLIQYEIKASSALRLDLVHQFRELGYRSYRLVPGLDLLVPFDDQASVDGFLLNLFCCKPDRAARLTAEGFLVADTPEIPSPRRADTKHIKYGWRETLGKLPYGALLSHSWATRDQNENVTAALFDYARSRDASLPAAERFAALEASYLGLRQLCETEPVTARLSSLARVAMDYGARSFAVATLGRLCEMLFQQGKVDTTEPFLAPGVRFDSLVPPDVESIRKWLTAGALEELERHQYFSSFFSEQSMLRRVAVIRDLGYASEEMKRRLMLIEQRFATPGA